MDLFFLQIANAFLAAKQVERQSRDGVRALQRKALDATLLHAYDRSAFYRNLWGKAGITREELVGISLERLPIVTKNDLMGSFADVVTEADITRADVEAFIKKDPTGREWYRGAYVAMNTSGSSGVIGVFLYSKAFWARLMGIIVSRLFRIPTWYFLLGRVRLAFVGETSGHHAGISLIKSAPAILNARSVDVASPQEEIVRVLEEHKPNVLAGYTSGLAVLADLALAGKISIKPEVIIGSGEALSPAREELITQAFGVRPINFYGATECLAMGASIYESGKLDIFDDLLKLEAVDDAGKPVPDGTLGRVVITILGNDIFPLIRYAIDDEIALGKGSSRSPFSVATTVSGRKMDRLVITLEGGKTFEVHPMDLVGLFFPGLKHYQIVQTSPRDVVLRVVVEGDKKQALIDANGLVDEFLEEQKLTRADITITVEFADAIPPNPKTGKTPIIVPLPKQ